MIDKTRIFTSFRTLLLILLITAVAWSVFDYSYTEAKTINSSGAVDSLFSPTREQSQTTRAIVKMLARFHYLDEKLDNSFSEKVFKNYIELLDPARSHFLAADIDEFARYRDSLDEDLYKGNLKHAFDIYRRYHERRKQRLAYTLALLEKGETALDFNKNEYIELDREHSPWLKDIDAARDLWRRLLKNEILNLKLGDDEEKEEIFPTLEKRYRSQLHFLEQTNSEDIFEYFISAYTHSYDPHTDYFPPDESENFDIHMRLSLEGIGALLQREDEYVKVVRLITGGPADRGNELQPADRIVAVGQGKKGELQDVQGWRLGDVVDLIRGPKGTVVRLKVIPADSTDISVTKIVTITRDTVKLEEQSAKKKVIEIKRDQALYKIGVIELPTFYIDFQAAGSGDPNYRSSTRDVEKLLRELLDEDIDGLVIDLRNNGGGSLQEATDMTGLFIRTGPIVQIRNADNRIDLHSDLNPKLVYTGPLAVLVNRLSASASEILAGAIQDHGRGIIIGSQTFGKGTVQTINRLDPGRLKFTQSKYYRISGDSTQERGVIPDIVFPSILDEKEVGESSLPQAMGWDHIQPVRYRKLANLHGTIDYLNRRHKQRVLNDPDFKYLNQRVAFLEENRNKTRVSLLETTRRKEREAMKQRFLSMENDRRKAQNLKPYKTYAEMEAAEENEDEESQRDSVLQESGDILIDWLIATKKQIALH